MGRHLAFMEQGLEQQARDPIDTTRPTELWERAIALFLHAHWLLCADPYR